MDNEQFEAAIAQLCMTIEQTLATLAAAVARQVDGALLASVLRDANASLAKRHADPLRDHWIEAMCSLIDRVGVPRSPNVDEPKH